MSTNIHDLPSDPTGGGGNNINLSVKDSQIPVQQEGQLPHQAPAPPQAIPQTIHENHVGSSIDSTKLDHNSINELVSGLQKLTMTGATQLPSRDIPTTTTHLSNDEEVQPNFVPRPSETNYIDDYQDNDDVINEYNMRVSKESQLDAMYNEFQTPILLAILFFLFQLPFFKKNLFTYAPALFMNDGNYNIYGFVFISMFFAFVYYLLSKSAVVFNRF